MNTQQLDELNRVLEKIREIAEKSAGGDYIYRGEPNCYPKVSSTLYREYEEEIEAESLEIDVVQEEILEEARKYTREAASDLEILTELQHHGGKTNLIDFTADYLIALFFASDGSPDKDGRIILLKKESDSYQVEKPPKTINRVESQKSIFVQNSRGFVAPDDEVIIPKDFKRPMLNYLRKHHDISTETIYNDLHGFIRIQDIHHQAYEALYRGLSAVDKGDFDKAIKDFTTAIELKPDFFGAYNNRGNAYFQKRDFDTAIQNYDTAIEIQPDYADAYNNRGNAYGGKRDFDTAIQNYDTAIEIKPDYADAYCNRGVAYAEKRDFDKAIQNYDTAIEIKPDYADAYHNRGNAYLEKHDFDTAIQNYDTAIEIKPDYADAYHGRGVAYAEKRDFDTAIQDLTTAIEIKPDDYKVYYLRGRTHRDKGDVDLALRDFNTAIKLNPDADDVYLDRGLIYSKKHDFESAIKDYSEAIRLNPEFAGAYHNRGFGYLLLEDLEAAIKDFDMVIELDPTWVGAYHGRGMAYFMIGEFKHAINNYSKAIKLKPDNAESYWNRGEAWMPMSEWDKAKEDFTAARNLGVDLVAFFHRMYEDVEDFESKYNVQIPKDLAELLTRQKVMEDTPLPQSRYELPILMALEELGGSAATHEVLRRVRQLMVDELREIDISRRSGRQVYMENRAHAMRSKLVRKGLMKDDSPHGIWEITDAGREYLRNNQGD
ncbi:hypothetical protein C6495_03085 [Candidatus Poribacteria bacterium]|nr:MAG: hypothetical protein C6495_03085 [Candidatus Poribacteria bacterium]